jgi:hypothetical protein
LRKTHLLILMLFKGNLYLYKYSWGLFLHIYLSIYIMYYIYTYMFLSLSLSLYVLEFELRALSLLGRCSTTWVTPQPSIKIIFSSNLLGQMWINSTRILYSALLSNFSVQFKKLKFLILETDVLEDFFLYWDWTQSFLHATHTLNH